jgi:hypothetical protein
VTDLTDDEKARLEQIRKSAVDSAMAWATLQVDMFVLDNRLLRRDDITDADKVRLIMEATLGYLVGHGMITVTDDPPYLLPNTIPEHLSPDVQGAVDNLWRTETVDTSGRL